MTQHRDCGAYGGTSAFVLPEAEKSKLVGDMFLVKESLRRKHPDLQIAVYWIEKSGEGWEFEEIIEARVIG